MSAVVTSTRSDVLHVTVATPYLKQKDIDSCLRAALGSSGYSELENVKNGFVTFDLSECIWHDLGAALWLITVLHKLKRQGNDLQLIFPEPKGPGRKLWSFLLRWRFFECLRQNVDLPVNLLRPSQLPNLELESDYGDSYGQDENWENALFHSARLLEMSTVGIEPRSDSERETALYAFLKRYTDRVIVGALAQICGWANEEAGAFARQVIGEAVRNASLHARGTFSIIAMRLDAKNLTLAIADNGIGIPDSLRELRPELRRRSDIELIVQYADPSWIVDSYLIKKSTMKAFGSPDRAGDGLYYLKTNVLDHRGELRIRSGNACVDFKMTGSKAVEETEDELVMSPGTTIRITIPRKLNASKQNKR